MKTRKQKVIFRILCMVVSIFLLASFFVVPVAALDQMTTFNISNIMYEYGSDPDADQRPFSSLYVLENSRDFSLTALDYQVLSFGDGANPLYIHNGYNQYMEFTFADVSSDFSYFGVYYINQLFDDNAMRTFASGDTLYLDSSFFACWTLDDSSLTQYRFTLRENGDPYGFSAGIVAASTDINNFLIDSDSEGFDYDRLAFNFTTDIQSNSLCLCFEFVIDLSDDSFEVGFESTDFRIQFGAGVSPNYPIYPSAPGGDDVDGLGSAEHELIQSQQQGVNAGLSVMEDTSSVLDDLNTSLQLGSFTTRLSGILDRVASIPGIDALVHVSLALGLFASLMALSASLVSAADRRAGQAKREAAREAKRDKKK